MGTLAEFQPSRHLMRKRFAVPLVVFSSITALSVWFSLPWVSTIESRVAIADPYKLVVEFDGWQTGRSHNAMHIEVGELPSAFRALKPVGARIRREGVYLVLKRGFVAEDGVFISYPEVSVPPSNGSDPSFRCLGSRVYRYHVSG